MPWSDDDHVYAVEWTSDRTEWSVDDVPYFAVTPDDLPAAWVFDHPFFMVLNVAVGGSWPGSPDATTVFPQQMLVDYVWVYQAPAEPPPPGTTVHVSNIDMATNSTGPFWQVVTTVTVRDGAGPVAGATVTGD